MLKLKWELNLKMRDDLNKYVNMKLQRKCVLDYMERDYGGHGQYKWSMRTLDRRMRYFGIYYTDSVDVEDVEEAVKEELEGPGQLLGYRAMHLVIRQKHKLRAPRDMVHDVMFKLDPEGLEDRLPRFKKKRKKGHFTSPGTNQVHSLDGHDKLMGYQNNKYPIAIYGCLDTCSRKLLWIRVWDSNSNPAIVGRWYLQYLRKTKTIAAFLRIDRGTETGTMGTMHAYLRSKNEEETEDDDDDEPIDPVIYGPSTSNQIERWWRELHERLEKFYKAKLEWLSDNGHYNTNNKVDRDLMKFLMIPLIQKEVENFVDVVWNPHFIRNQAGVKLPNGVPNHIYDFPHQYGLQECGYRVKTEDLDEVEELSGVKDLENLDYIADDFRISCESVLPHPAALHPKDVVNAFIGLKHDVLQLRVSSV